MNEQKTVNMKQIFCKQFFALVFTLLFATLPIAFAVSINPSSILVSVTDSTATINWQTDTESTGLVNYGETTSSSSMQSAASTLGEGTTQNVSLTNLDANQYYYYNIQASDSSGTYTSTYMNFTTLLSAPQNLKIASLSQNQVELQWDKVTGAQYYNVYKDGGLVGVAPAESFETSALSYKATYSFVVHAVDKYGRESAASSSLSVTTQEQAVNITFVQATSVTKTSAVISWQTDREVNGTVLYGTSSGNLNQSQVTALTSTTNEMSLNNLEEDKTYYYKIISAATISSETYSFKTLGDETTAEISSVAIGDVTRGTVEISWITNYETQGSIYYSTDDSFSQYKKEDSDQVKHNEQLEDLLAGMTYYFKIVLDDAQKTESGIYNFTTSESLYDFLDLLEVPSLVNNATIVLTGTTAENAKLYVFVNKDANPYAQYSTIVNGTSFSVAVTLNPYSYIDGVKGRNIVEVDSWDSNNNKAMKNYTIDVDTAVPLLTVNNFSLYTAETKINISGVTDPDVTIGFFIDGKSKGSLYVSNASGAFAYMLDVGSATTNHTIDVQAVDAAGNIASVEKIIFVDHQDPKLEFYTSFTSDTHYKLFRVDGHTEPGASIVVTNYGEYSGCDSPEFESKYGSCEYLANVNGPGPYQSFDALLDPTSLMVDLLSLNIGVPTSTVADDQGNFSIIVSLLAGTVPTTGASWASTPAVSPTNLAAKNTLVFNVTDLAGNTYSTEKQITYQPSCADWILGKTTSLPINIYSNDLTAGNLLGSALFDLSYVGGGTPEVAKITVQKDDSAGQVIKQGVVEVGTSSSAVSYTQTYGGLENSNEYITISSQTIKSTPYNAENGKVYVYAPVTINKYSADINEMPEQLGVYLDTYISYTDGNGQAANCHLYPTVSYDIQKPESFTKWLSPTMINQTISILDQTINITESAVKYLGIAARWTTVGCGATIAWNYLKGFGTQKTSECNENLKSIYAVCDRILCPPIPPNCDGFKAQGEYKFTGADGNVQKCPVSQGEVDPACKAKYDQSATQNQKTYNAMKDEYETYKEKQQDVSFDTYYEKQKNIAEKKNELNDFSSKYPYDQKLSEPTKYTTTDPVTGEEVTVQYLDVHDKIPGTSTTAADKYISDCPDPKNTETIILFTGLDKEQTSGFSIGGSKSVQSKGVWCSEDSLAELDEPSAKDIPGCYSEDCPQFDNTKCVFGKGYNVNPAEDLFGSLQCGCITGAKGHLENLLKIMYGMKKCLQQALIGETTAGYCERLMSYFVCDILTQIFKHIFSSLGQGTGVIAGMIGEESLANYQDNAGDISKGLKSRYGGIVQNQLGLSTDDILNKACLAAFTADWTVLEDALDSIVEQIPVAPIASAQATSRPYGFDPFTGKITISYNLYVGIVPGGDTKISAWLECDKGYPGGEYCADVGSDKIDLVAKGKIPGFMNKDGFFDENIAYIAENAASWHNKLTLQLTYVTGGEEETETIIKPITKKGDISMLDCSFSVASGIDCSIGAKFMDLAEGVGGTVLLYSTSGGTKITPSASAYYADNQVAALVKINNGYPQNFFIKVDNPKQSFEYTAIGGTDTGDYRGTQWYLLWIDNAAQTTQETSSSTSGTSADVLKEWAGKIVLLGSEELGFTLPSVLDKVTLNLYPEDANGKKEKVSCVISTQVDPQSAVDTGQKDVSGNTIYHIDTYENQYGVRFQGTFYPITSEAEFKNFCKIDTSFSDCSFLWSDPLKEQYSRLAADGSYKCITKYDTLATISLNQIDSIRHITFTNEFLSENVGVNDELQFILTDAETDDGKKYITTQYASNSVSSSSSSSSSSSASTRTTKINILADLNGNGIGESLIYSPDTKPKNQEIKLSYSATKNPASTNNLKPLIDFIEPTTVIDQSTGYVNSDGEKIPVGFALWDDKNEILTLSIGIVGFDGSACLAKWTYDQAADKLPVRDSSNSAGDCGLTPTERTTGFADHKPPFFEFDLDPSTMEISNDAYYDVTIFAVDKDQNQAEPKIKRIKFSDQFKEKYNDLLVCLGSAECSSGFSDSFTEEVMTDLESVATTSAQEQGSGSSSSSSSDSDEELNVLTSSN